MLRPFAFRNSTTFDDNPLPKVVVVEICEIGRDTGVVVQVPEDPL